MVDGVFFPSVSLLLAMGLFKNGADFSNENEVILGTQFVSSHLL